MKPVIHETAFVADNATVRGNVTIGEGAGIYFGAVLRAETDPITIGPGANIQDNCVLHADPGFPTSVGRDCTVGHAAILPGCGKSGAHHAGAGSNTLHHSGAAAAGAGPGAGAQRALRGLRPDAGGDRIQRRSRRRLPPRIPVIQSRGAVNQRDLRRRTLRRAPFFCNFPLQVPAEYGINGVFKML